MTEFRAALAKAHGIISQALALLLLAAIGACVLKWFGVRMPFAVAPLELAYVAGAFWLVTRGQA